MVYCGRAVYVGIVGVRDRRALHAPCIFRLIIASQQIAITLMGLIIQYTTTNDGARLFGYYIIVCFIPALAQLFSFPAANVTG